MNNSAIPQTLRDEPEHDVIPQLRQREEELVSIIESIHSIAGSSAWKTLEEYIFKELMDSINTRLQSASGDELYRLQGEARWARKYANFSSLSEKYLAELQAIKHKIHG